MKFILSHHAYRSIIEECLSFPDVETGGILVGKKINDQCIVAPFTLGSGKSPFRTRTRYSPDVQWQQVHLEKLFDRYGVNYVGSYHRHPGNNCFPSSYDYRAACHIVNDPAWNVTDAIFPIINLIGNKISFYPYYFSRTLREFRLIHWQIMSPKDKLIKCALRRRSS